MGVGATTAKEWLLTQYVVDVGTPILLKDERQAREHCYLGVVAYPYFKEGIWQCPELAQSILCCQTVWIYFIPYEERPSHNWEIHNKNTQWKYGHLNTPEISLCSSLAPMQFVQGRGYFGTRLCTPKFALCSSRAPVKILPWRGYFMSMYNYNY